MPATVHRYDDGRIRLRALTTWHPYFAQFTSRDWALVASWLSPHRAIGVEHPETGRIFPLIQEKDGTWRCLRGPLGEDLPSPSFVPDIPGFMEYGDGSWLSFFRVVGYALLVGHAIMAAMVGAWVTAGVLVGGVALSIGLLWLVYGRMVQTQIPRPRAVLPQTPSIAISSRTGWRAFSRPGPAIPGQVKGGVQGQKKTAPASIGIRHPLVENQTQPPNDQNDPVARQQEENLADDTPMTPSCLHPAPVPTSLSIENEVAYFLSVDCDDRRHDRGKGHADGDSTGRPQGHCDMTHFVKPLHQRSAKPKPQDSYQDPVYGEPRDDRVMDLKMPNVLNQGTDQSKRQTPAHHSEHPIHDAARAYEWMGWSLAAILSPIVAIAPAWHVPPVLRVFQTGAPVHWSALGYAMVPLLTRLSGSSSFLLSIPFWHAMTLGALGMVSVTSLMWYIQALWAWSSWQTLPLIRLAPLAA